MVMFIIDVKCYTLLRDEEPSTVSLLRNRGTYMRIYDTRLTHSVI